MDVRVGVDGKHDAPVGLSIFLSRNKNGEFVGLFVLVPMWIVETVPQRAIDATQAVRFCR
jgi:hypothetical protein